MELEEGNPDQWYYSLDLLLSQKPVNTSNIIPIEVSKKTFSQPLKIKKNSSKPKESKIKNSKSKKSKTTLKAQDSPDIEPDNQTPVTIKKISNEINSDNIEKDLVVYHRSKHLMGKRNNVILEEIKDMITLSGEVLLVAKEPRYVEFNHPLKDVVSDLNINQVHSSIIIDEIDMNYEEGVMENLYSFGKLNFPEKSANKNGSYIKFHIEILK